MCKSINQSINQITQTNFFYFLVFTSIVNATNVSAIDNGSDRRRVVLCAFVSVIGSFSFVVVGGCLFLWKDMILPWNVGP